MDNPSVAHPPRSGGGLSRSLADSPIRAVLRLAAGLVFLIFGLEKAIGTIALGNALVHLPNGPKGFALYLAAVGIPFPLANAYLVLAVEIGCGLGLLVGIFLKMTRHLTRLFALTLAGDMAVATALVGLRDVLHHPVLIQGMAVTAQFWRFPLEFGLLACMTYFLFRPHARSASRVESSPRLVPEVALARRPMSRTRRPAKARRTLRASTARRAAA